MLAVLTICQDGNRRTVLGLPSLGSFISLHLLGTG